MPTDTPFNWTPIIEVTVVLIGLILLWSLVGYPKWRVWAAHQQGLADLAAEAVAEQVSKIGTELTHHDLYLRWQWIKMMEDAHAENDSTIIYVPTEANLPILEATRFRNNER